MMRLRWMRLAMFGLVVAVSTGCYRTRVAMGDGPKVAPGRAAGAAEDTRWLDGAYYHSVIYGLVDLSGPVRLREVCPEGVEHIDQKKSFLAGLLSGLTGGIYTPQSVRVFCRGGATVSVPSAQLEQLARQQHERFAGGAD